jgi:hypothetical protein
MRSCLTLGLCSARGGMQIRAVPRESMYSSLRTHSCHGGRNKQHVFSLLPQWAALRPLLLSHPSLRGVGHNCRLASCGRHGSELRDMVQPVRQHSIIGLGGWSRAIRNTCREPTAEGHCTLTPKWVVEDQRNRLPALGKVLFPKLQHRCSRGKAQSWSLLQLTTPAGFTFIGIHTRLGQRWTSPATCTRLGCDST